MGYTTEATVAKFGLRDELVEVETEGQRSASGLEIWGDFRRLVGAQEASLVVVVEHDDQPVIEDPEVLARPALISVGQIGAGHHSNHVPDRYVLAVGRELKTGVVRERFAHDPYPLDPPPGRSGGR